MTLSQSIPCPGGLTMHRDAVHLLGVSVGGAVREESEALVARRTHVTIMNKYYVVINKALVGFLPLLAPPFHSLERTLRF